MRGDRDTQGRQEDEAAMLAGLRAAAEAVLVHFRGLLVVYERLLVRVSSPACLPACTTAPWP
jgi:hypothetical protein